MIVFYWSICIGGRFSVAYDSICKLNIQKYMYRNPVFYGLKSFSMMAFSKPRRGCLETNASHSGSEGRSGGCRVMFLTESSGRSPGGGTAMPLGRSFRRDVPETVSDRPCSVEDSCGHPCGGWGRLPEAVPAEEGVGEGDELAYGGDEGGHVQQAARLCVATVGAAVAAQGRAALFESGGQAACVDGRPDACDQCCTLVRQNRRGWLPARLRPGFLRALRCSRNWCNSALDPSSCNSAKDDSSGTVAPKPSKRRWCARTSASARSVLTSNPKASPKCPARSGSPATVSTPSAARHWRERRR